jgi:hypothetical protein
MVAQFQSQMKPAGSSVHASKQGPWTILKGETDACLIAAALMMEVVWRPSELHEVLGV